MCETLPAVSLVELKGKKSKALVTSCVCIPLREGMGIYYTPKFPGSEKDMPAHSFLL